MGQPAFPTVALHAQGYNFPVSLLSLTAQHQRIPLMHSCSAETPETPGLQAPPVSLPTSQQGPPEGASVERCCQSGLSGAPWCVSSAGHSVHQAVAAGRGQGVHGHLQAGKCGSTALGSNPAANHARPSSCIAPWQRCTSAVLWLNLALADCVMSGAALMYGTACACADH